MAASTSWMDAIPAAAPTQAMQMLGTTVMPAQPAPSAPPPSGLPASVTGALSQMRGAAPASSTSWMDAIPAAQPTQAMQMMNQKPQPAGKLSGLVANLGAGTSEGLADTLGFPVDAATGAINLGIRGVNALAGTKVPQIQNPVGGSNSIKSAEGLIGADPRNVQAGDEADQLARSAGSGAASAVLPWGVARALPGATGLFGAAQDMFGAGSASRMAAVGATGGAAGQEASDSVPEPYKPLANLAGNVLGGGVTAGLGAVADAAIPSSAKAVQGFIQPLRTGDKTGWAGRKLDALFAGGQQTAAGQRIANAATDPNDVRATLDESAAAEQQAAPLRAILADPHATPAQQEAAQDQLTLLAPKLREVVPGSQPTTFQLTGDQGLGQLERSVGGGSGGNNPAFVARVGDQNAARVGQIDRQAPPDADPAAVGEAFKNHLADLDAQSQAFQAGLLGDAQKATNDLGAPVPAGADQQASMLQRLGAPIRASLQTGDDAAAAATTRLFNAVDPDGMLRVPMAPVRQGASDILQGRPQNAEPLSAKTQAIFGTAQMQPAQQSFAELSALRSRITTQLRNVRINPDLAGDKGPLTQLLAAVDATLQGGVEQKAAADAAAVQAGQMKPEDATVSRLSEEVQDWYARRASQQQASTSRGGRGQGSGPPSEGRPSPSAGVFSSEREGAWGPGSPPRDQGVQGNEGHLNEPYVYRPLDVDRPTAGKLFYHGTKSPLGKLSDADVYQHSRIDNLYGEGLYLTDNPEVAASYAKNKGSGDPGRVLGARLNNLRLLDLEGHLPPDAENEFRRQIDNLSGEEPEDGATGKEVFKALKQAMRDAELTTGDAHEVYGELAGNLAGMGYDGFRHEGGHNWGDGKEPHNVAILFENDAIGPNGAKLPGALRDKFTDFTPQPPAKFWDAAAAKRYAAARASHADRKSTFANAPGVGAVLKPDPVHGEYAMAESSVPSAIFTSGKGAAERIQAYQRAGGDAKAVEDYAAFDFRRSAENADGTIDPKKAEKWLAAHREVMGAYPDLAKKFATAADARRTLDEVAAQHRVAVDEFQKSAAGKFLGDRDPVTTIGQILKSPTSEATMRDLARKTAGNRDARAGLQKAAIDYILRDLRANTVIGESSERQMKADQFQTFLRRSGPALRQIFSPQQVRAIEDVATDIQRSARSVTGTKIAGGSNTAHDLAAMSKHGGAHSSPISLLAWMESLGHAAGHIAGPVGKIAGTLIVPLMNGARQAGMEKIDDLVTQAMLHPEIARALLAKVPPNAFGKSVVANAVKQIQAVGAMSAANEVMRGKQQ